MVWLLKERCPGQMDEATRTLAVPLQHQAPCWAFKYPERELPSLPLVHFGMRGVCWHGRSVW